MGFLNKLFRLGPKVDIKRLIQTGKAQIIDVRTPGEYSAGHVSGSVNIPLQQLQGEIKKIKKDRPLVLCCASGMRSGQAVRILKSKGYDAYNGGGWQNVNRFI